MTVKQITLSSPLLHPPLLTRESPMPASDRNCWIRKVSWSLSDPYILQRYCKKKTNTSGCKRGAIHVEDDNVKRDFVDKVKCRCRCALNKNMQFQQKDFFIMSHLLHAPPRRRSSPEHFRHYPVIVNASDIDYLWRIASFVICKKKNSCLKTALVKSCLQTCREWGL